jgi:hypothetical protein
LNAIGYNNHREGRRFNFTLKSQILVYIRGLQFYTFFGISIGIKRRIIDNGKKITFYFLQNV